MKHSLSAVLPGTFLLLALLCAQSPTAEATTWLPPQKPLSSNDWLE